MFLKFLSHNIFLKLQLDSRIVRLSGFDNRLDFTVD